MRQNGHDPQKFARRGKNCGFALRVGFGIAQRPGFFGGEIFVGDGDHCPEGFQRAGEIHLFEIVENIADSGLCVSRERFVLRLELPRLRNFARETFLDHGSSAAG